MPAPPEAVPLSVIVERLVVITSDAGDAIDITSGAVVTLLTGRCMVMPASNGVDITAGVFSRTCWPNAVTPITSAGKTGFTKLLNIIPYRPQAI